MEGRYGQIVLRRAGDMSESGIVLDESCYVQRHHVLEQRLLRTFLGGARPILNNSEVGK